MDWLGELDPFLYPVAYIEVEPMDPPATDERLIAWLILTVIALTAVVLWYRFGVWRHAFWCATAGPSRMGPRLPALDAASIAASACSGRQRFGYWRSHNSK